MLEIVKDYAQKKLELIKLEATEKSVTTAGLVTVFALVGVAALFFIILLNIGIGLLIGAYLGNYGYGVLIVAGFYLLLMIIFLLSKNAIKNSIANLLLKSLNK